eukprot:m.188599 g.188599  ORF g.188599 m.188599 type:complete len:222 (+) comp32350_c0_seq1:95-760(+)
MAAPKPYRQRLLKDYSSMKRSPPPHIFAAPLPSNILEWRFCVYGLKDCDYEGGYYHGKLLFPEQYPFKPPGIMMLTPSGRFQCATRLCLSMSDFHPDQWNPAWNVESILKGLVSFMVENTATAGSIVTSSAEKKRFAKNSADYNLKDADFCELFPEVLELIEKERKESALKPKTEDNSAVVDGLQKSPTDSVFETPGSNLVLIFVVAAFAYLVSTILAEQD